MNKDFIKLVQDAGDYKSAVAAKVAIVAFTEAVKASANKGIDVSLVGFGSFKTSIRKGRTGTIPGTTKQYTTTDKRVVRFSVGSKLAESALGE